MDDGNKNIVILVLQYSVVVKGIERKLNDAGYRTMILQEDYEKIDELSEKTDLFFLYLPGDIVNNGELMDKMRSICDRVRANDKKMILVGETRDYGALVRNIPLVLSFSWIDRPVEMDVLGPAIENTIAGNVVGGKKCILIVDDDSSYAMMIKEWIKGEYQAEIVTAGMLAITYLLKNHVDLILLDYEMPVVDGPQVLQMLRQEPQTAHIPVIFLTGIGTKDAVERVMRLKPDGYILKSATKEELLKYMHDKLGQ